MEKDSALKRNLTWFGSVDEKNSTTILNQIKELHEQKSKDPISLTLSSLGGGTFESFTFHEMITELIKPNLTVIGCGTLESAGIIIFCAGSKRLVTRNTTLFLHEVARNYTNNVFTATGLENEAKNLSYKQNRYAEIIADAIGVKLSKKQILNMMIKETRLNAQECVKYGIAHDIM